LAATLASNVTKAIKNFGENETSCWSDSTVALHYINGGGEFRQFVSNRVRKIRDQDYIQWHFVPTKENPADIGSRDGSTVDNELWTISPEWLSNPGKCPAPATIEASSGANAESKVTKRIRTTAITRDDDRMDELLEAHDLRNIGRVSAWVRRFVNNSNRRLCPINERNTGPLSAAEIQDQHLWWTKRAQEDATNNGGIEKQKIQLNLQLNDAGVLEC
jgi:hypothetical protein